MNEFGDGNPVKDVTVPAERMSNDTVGEKKPAGGWRNWIKRFARGAAIGTAVGLPAVGAGTIIQNQYEENVVRQEQGQPVEGATPFAAQLINSADSNGKEITPTFWTGATDQSQQLSLEELKEKGIDPNDPNLMIVDVEGQTYASAGKPGEQSLGFHAGKDGKNYGAWGEIVVGDKRTGIFVPGKYIDERSTEEPKPAE